MVSPKRTIAVAALGMTLGAGVLLSVGVAQQEGLRTSAAGSVEMSIARAAHQATVLEGGEILITGGCAERGCRRVLASAESYDPVSGEFRAAPAMATPRASHTAVALADGDVLIVGGWTGSEATASAERFDRRTRTFVPLAPMGAPRMSPSVVVLQDGRVLVAGGELRTGAPLATAEIYDPVTRRFVPAGDMQTPRSAHVAIALADGRVLVVGGHRARGDVVSSAEIFDPSTLTFRPTADMRSARHKHAGVRLGDGRILVLGGADARDGAGMLRSTEIFDPGSSTFSPGPPMSAARYKFRDAVLALPTGEVLVAGGAAAIERWDPALPAFRSLTTLDAARYFATATLLPDGRALVLGGYDEEIRPAASARVVHP